MAAQLLNLISNNIVAFIVIVAIIFAALLIGPAFSSAANKQW